MKHAQTAGHRLVNSSDSLSESWRQISQHQLCIHTLPLLIVNVAVCLIHNLLLDELFKAIFQRDDAHRAALMIAAVMPCSFLQQQVAIEEKVTYCIEQENDKPTSCSCKVSICQELSGKTLSGRTLNPGQSSNVMTPTHGCCCHAMQLPAAAG